ncbi:hypothetical protein PLCT2_00083 [Planctomycetaceae bacterium]|nr:hypothetical protein PLCT2_00083 [Planctomycetaceae bacterium]
MATILALCLDELSLRAELTSETELETDRCLWGTLAFLGNIHFNPAYAAAKRELVPSGSLDAWGYFFDIASLGRACAASSTKTLSGADWFKLKSEEILKQQHKDGGWHSKGSKRKASGDHEVVNTCFAMLFLKKFVPLILSESRRGPDAPPRKQEK